jgi:hypothetical protein
MAKGRPAEIYCDLKCPAVWGLVVRKVTTADVFDNLYHRVCDRRIARDRAMEQDVRRTNREVNHAGRAVLRR